MDMILSECMSAANEMARHGGLAPAQWELSRLPRNPATVGDEDECLDVGAVQAHADGPTTFGVRSRYRAGACEAFVRWDCCDRVGRAALRKAAPVVGSYQIGDIISYCRVARAGEHGLQWSVGFRLIGSVKDKNSLGETQSRTCWVICDSVPVCVAIDRSRPCTPAELLAFHDTQTKSSSPLAADAQTQQDFIDERAPLHNPTAADPSRTAEEDEDEDERDDENVRADTNNEGREAKEDSDGRNCKKVKGTDAKSCFVTCEFIETF